MASLVLAPSFRLFMLLLSLLQGGAVEIIAEEGYSVSTVLDGDKYEVKVNPHSILPQSPSSDSFVLLDSVASAFYTISLPTTSSGESMIKKIAGNGRGYKDGSLDTAMFSQPKNFAIDFKGNIYVADRTNSAIRKITKSGVTTIGNASFSNDFELSFAPERCALMIIDHSKRLIHQMSLEQEDCSGHSGSALGSTTPWIIGLALSCLMGLVVGFAIRPYILPCEGGKPFHWSSTWKRCLMSLERQTVMLCCDIRNAIASSSFFLFLRQFLLFSFSQLCMMFRFNLVESRNRCHTPISLLDCDATSSNSSSNSLIKPPTVGAQLKDLLTFEMFPANSNEVVKQKEETISTDVSSGKWATIDSMIQANIENFNKQMSTEDCSSEYLMCSYGGLIKRR